MADRFDLRAVTQGWIDQIERDTGLDYTNIARRAGLAASTLTRFRAQEDVTLSAGTIAKLTLVHPTPLPDVLRTKVKHLVGTGNTSPAGSQLAYHSDIPIWGVHPLRFGGYFRLNANPIQSMQRPPGLSATGKTAAFFMPDDSMEPRWMSGELVIVDLARPAHPHGFALVTVVSPDGENREEAYLLRRYIGRGQGRVRLAPLNEAYEANDIPAAQVLDIRHVLAWRDLLS